MIRRSDHLHLLPVIAEFFSTIQAHDVGGTRVRAKGARITGLSGNWKRTVLVRTAEQCIDESGHLIPLRRVVLPIPLFLMRMNPRSSQKFQSCIDHATEVDGAAYPPSVALICFLCLLDGFAKELTAWENPCPPFFRRCAGRPALRPRYSTPDPPALANRAEPIHDEVRRSGQA